MNKELREKVFKVKADLGKIPKDSVNPYFKSRYFDINSLLEHVEPVLQKHGLLVVQPVTTDSVTTSIIDVETGGSIESVARLTTSGDPQKLGSEITYLRRYTLQSLLALQAEDDDANAASGCNRTPVSKSANLPVMTDRPGAEEARKKSLAEMNTLNQLRSEYTNLLSTLSDDEKTKYALNQMWSVEKVQNGVKFLRERINNAKNV
jgi:hypothetical protein